MDVVTPAQLLAQPARADVMVASDGVPGGPALLVDLDDADWDWDRATALASALAQRHTRLLVGRCSVPVPAEGEPLLDRLDLTLCPGGPGRSWVPEFEDDLARIEARTTASPRAAVALGHLLRVTPRLAVPQALAAESFAYSTLLGGPEFAGWRAAHPPRRRTPPAEPVALERDGDRLVITLDVPERHNAFSAAVRDGLLNALAVAEADPDLQVLLRGKGRSFSSGGDLDEFGSTPDVATAHLVRTAASPGLVLHRLRDRVTARLHGACIGAGIEVPAFAGSMVADEETFFALPELAYGLVPGAGGTVSVTRRIGRWRTAYLVLTGCRLDVPTAVSWGLVDDVA